MYSIFDDGCSYEHILLLFKIPVEQNKIDVKNSNISKETEKHKVAEDRKQLCSYEGNKVYDSFNPFLKREIGCFDMEENVYRNNTLIGKVDTDGYTYYSKEQSDYQNIEKRQGYAENNSLGNVLIDCFGAEYLVGAWMDLKFERMQKVLLIDVLMWIFFIIENLLIGLTCVNFFVDAPKGIIIFPCVIVSISMFNFIRNKNRATVLEIIKTFFYGIICNMIRLAGVVSEIYGLYYLYIFFMYLTGNK